MSSNSARVNGPRRRPRRMLVGIEDVAFVAELRRGDRQHAAELTAADDPDGRARRDHSGASATDPVCASRHASSRRASASSSRREHRRGKQRCVDRAGLADRQRPDRNAGGHLHDREQAIHALQRLAFDRHAEHWQPGHRRGHARQMRRAAGTGDHDLQAAFPARNGRNRTAASACDGRRRSCVSCATPSCRASRRRGASSPSRSCCP